MNARIRGSAIGLALAWVAIGGALAADVVFTITGDGRTTTFELPLNPAMLLNNVSGVVLVGFAGLAFAGYRALRMPDPLIRHRAHPA